jgi:curved DNA-binding protein CbpA
VGDPQFDPYAVLGLSREATPADIKTAFRVKSKATHPDPGGGRREFELVKRAHLVLSDPDRREHYDKMGEVVEPEIDQGDRPAFGIIMGMLAQVLIQDEEPTRADLVAAMRGHLQKEIANAQARDMQLERTVARTASVAPRFRRRAGPDVIALMLENHARDIRQSREKLASQTKWMRRAAEILDEYTFEVESSGVVMFTFDGFSASTGAS